MTKYRIVPVETTFAMRKAFNDANDKYEEGFGESPDIQWKAMLAAAPSPWISVEERLPEPENGSRESGLVLTYNPYGIIVGFYCHEEALWYYSDGEEIDQYVSEITHWMPLPEAPEKSE